MPYNWETDYYEGLSCPCCGSPNVEIDGDNIWFCYDCDKEGFTPIEEGEC